MGSGSPQQPPTGGGVTPFDAEATTVAYSNLRPTYIRFANKLSELIREVVATSGVEIHQIEQRAKAVDDFKEKIERPGKHYTDPLNEVTDLAGVRVIAYYLEDVATICEILRREFSVDEANSEDPSARLAPNAFGYRSSHLVIALSPPRKTLAEYRDFADLRAEVQVRTVLQHAWAAIDHKLRYKGTAEVPVEIQRKLFRISAMMELGDEQFSNLRNATEAIRESYQENVARGSLDIELNAVSLLEYLRTGDRLAKLTDLAKLAGWRTSALDEAVISLRSVATLLPDMNRKADQLEDSRLLDTVSANFYIFPTVNIETIREIDEIIGDGDWAVPILKEIADESIMLGFHPIAGPVDVITIMVLSKKRNQLTENNLNVLRWRAEGVEATRRVIFGIA